MGKPNMYDSTNELAFKSVDQSSKVGETYGTLWANNYASKLEIAHFDDTIYGNDEMWENWRQETSQYTHAQRFFFALVGDGSCDCNEAEAFWKRYCEWALVDSVCFHGFVLGAAETTCTYPDSYEPDLFELEYEIERQQDRADAWEIGAYWAQYFATPEQLNALRDMTTNRLLPWRQWLSCFSTYSAADRIYFVIAGNVAKDRQAANEFWEKHTLMFDDSDSCAIEFVCGAMNIEKPSLVRNIFLKHGVQLLAR
jgi:hypothetical protein